MKDLIVNILKQYKELTSLSEGDYDYMIYGDDENLNEIAQEIEKALNNLVEQIKYITFVGYNGKKVY